MSNNIPDKENMQKLLKIAPKYVNGNAFTICMLRTMRIGECWGLSISDVSRIFMKNEHEKRIKTQKKAGNI